MCNSLSDTLILTIIRSLEMYFNFKGFTLWSNCLHKLYQLYRVYLVHYLQWIILFWCLVPTTTSLPATTTQGKRLNPYRAIHQGCSAWMERGEGEILISEICSRIIIYQLFKKIQEEWKFWLLNGFSKKWPILLC